MPHDALNTPIVRSLETAINERSQNRWQRQPKGILVTVTKVQGEMVKVKAEMQGKYTIPEITIPQAFSQWIREPTQVGDKGWAVSADFYLGGQSGLGGGTADYRERANLTTLAFQPVSQVQFPSNPTRDPDKVFINGKKGSRTQTTDGKITRDLDKTNGFTHKSVDPSDNSTDPFTNATKYFAHYVHPTNGNKWRRKTPTIDHNVTLTDSGFNVSVTDSSVPYANGLSVTGAGASMGGFSMGGGGMSNGAGFSVDSAGNVSGTTVASSSVLKLSPLTVATLPAPVGSGGRLAYVTDANSLTNGSTVAGGGSHHAIVKCDGTNWIVLG